MSEQLRNRKSILLGLLACAGLALIFYPRDSSEKQIRQLFDKGCALAAIAGPEPLVQRLEKAKELSALFRDEVQIRAELFGEERTVSNKDEFRQKVIAGRAALSALELKVEDYKFDIKGDRASVELSFSILGAMPGAQGKFFEQHRLRVGLIETGNWQIESIEHLANLREPETE